MRKATTSLILAGLVFLVLAPLAFGQDLVHLRGTIQKTVGDTLYINNLEGGTTSFTMPPEMLILTSRVAEASDITQGKFIGATATSLPDGRLTAMEVHIFSEAARGVGEGHYPWSLGMESSMTNANIESMVSSMDGPVMTLKYKDGEKEMVIPQGIPVAYLDKATNRRAMTVGAHIFVLVNDDDPKNLVAVALVVGLDRSVPPM